MAGHELIDEYDRLLYLLSLDAFSRQQAAVLDDPAQTTTSIFWDNQNLLMAALFAPALADIMLAGGAFAANSLDLASVVIDELVNVEDFADTYAFELVKGINDKSRIALQEVFTEAVAENLSLAEITEALVPTYGEVRSSLIAVTETTRAYNIGAVETQKQLANQGIITIEVWHTVRDNRVDEDCKIRDGMPRGTTWTDPAPPHPGCRCWITLEPIFGEPIEEPG